MFSEDATVDAPKLDLPADLLAEVSHRNRKRQPTDFSVEGMKPSLIERLAQMLGLN